MRSLATSFAIYYLLLPFHKRVDVHGEGGILYRGFRSFLWHVTCGDDDLLGRNLFLPKEVVDFGVALSYGFGFTRSTSTSTFLCVTGWWVR
ncbi:MAG: hypothetical protein ACK56F_25475, partial [bacterium]